MSVLRTGFSWGALALLAAAPSTATVLERVEPVAGDATAFVLHLSGPVTPSVSLVPAVGTLPIRLAVDLPDTTLGKEARGGIAGRGEVRRVRTGQLSPSVTRVVLELEHSVRYRVDRDGNDIHVVFPEPGSAEPARPTSSATPPITAPSNTAPTATLPPAAPSPTARTLPQGHPVFLDYSRELAGEEPLPEPPIEAPAQRPTRRTLHVGPENALPSLDD